MATTRPTVGGSAGTWGTELNEHLDVSLDTNGEVDDGAEQTTEAAPTTNKALANKKYVDDEITTLTSYVDSTYLSGQSVQVVNTQTQARNYQTSVPAMPHDTSIPQITEGALAMTRTVTPTNASNLLKIEITAYVESGDGTNRVAALFKDDDADAVAVGQGYGTGTIVNCITFTYWMVAGTTNEISFTTRMGCDGTNRVVLNGTHDTEYYGGTLTSSITITEIKV